MYDLCIIGAGWAGFTAALEARKRGLKACLVEKDSLGGVCLNQGCIPTKVFVHSATLITHIKNSALFGIDSEIKSIDFQKLQLRKRDVVDRLKKGIEFQLKSKGVDFLVGAARLVDSNSILVDGKKIESRHILIATGSVPVELPQLKFDGKKVLSSKEVLRLESIPQSLLIVGGGVIGCEFASAFSALGTKVTVVELLDRILPTEDREIAKKIEALFKKKGIEVLTGTNVDSVPKDNFEKVLVCVGRKAYSDELGLDAVGVQLDKSGIQVNEFLQTSNPAIYAIGDCIGGMLLAHVASYEAVVAVENISGKKMSADYSAVPNAIFTEPEIGSVGFSEEQAREAGYDVQTTKFNFLASGKAHIINETGGFVKIIFDKQSKRILGGVIFGASATELIAIVTQAVKVKLTIDQIYDTIFAHPTLSEGIVEAARESYPL
ncbi:dihydrolipoyl dehydrogenase [Candidatus Omnitrophota bacterium]